MVEKSLLGGRFIHTKALTRPHFFPRRFFSAEAAEGKTPGVLEGSAARSPSWEGINIHARMPPCWEVG